jgi:hypothetical protein
MFVGKARGLPWSGAPEPKPEACIIHIFTKICGIEYYSKKLCSEGLLTIELSFEEEKLESFG